MKKRIGLVVLLIKPGEGRLLDCLSQNEAKVSSRCNSALKNAGYKK